MNYRVKGILAASLGAVLLLGPIGAQADPDDRREKRERSETKAEKADAVPTGEQLLRWQDKVASQLPNVRVIPQTHLMMEMLQAQNQMP